MFHVPNGGLRTKHEAAKFKAIGVVAGIPDLVLVLENGQSYFFEMKGDTTPLSKGQIRLHKAWRSKGIEIFVCRTLEEFQEKFKQVI